MSKDIRILDCTLRDGGYLIGRQFGEDTIKGITEGLAGAGIDIIEVGFLQTAGQGPESTVYGKISETEAVVGPVKKLHPETRFDILADVSRFDFSGLEPQAGLGVDTIRVCFFKWELEEAKKACRTVRSRGYRILLQPVDIMGYTDGETEELAGAAGQMDIESFSIVDTHGRMYLDDLRRKFEILDGVLPESCHIGLHTHNNSQLSVGLLQYITEINEGRRKLVLDGSLGGMGRGAGNAPTELAASFLNSRKGGNYSIDKILDTIDRYIEPKKEEAGWGYSTKNFVAGYTAAHVNNTNYLTGRGGLTSTEIRMILEMVPPEKRGRYDYDLLDRLYEEFMNGKRGEQHG